MIIPVITGVGVVSAFGNGWEVFSQNLRQGLSGITGITHFDISNFPVKMGGEVPAAILDAHCPEPWQTLGAFRDRKVLFGFLAAQEAWKMAGCGRTEEQAPLILGLGLEHAFLPDFLPLLKDHKLDWSGASESSVPLVRYRSEVDLAAQVIHDCFKLTGPLIVNSSACAAGAMAVGQAAQWISRGLADIVVTGAADSMLNPLGMGGMSRLGAPSPRHTIDCCKPFDKHRDGLVIGEGAAVFIVESSERALARGAKPLAAIIGYGCTQDGYRATAPRPDGGMAARAMQIALESARVTPQQVDYINAHGTGTPLNDRAESLAIRLVFGPHTDHLPVSSIKGAVGHLMAAAGAIEIAACLLPLTRNTIPGTAHHRDRDPECDVNVVGPVPIECKCEMVLTNSFGFGGQNASLLLGRAS